MSEALLWQQLEERLQAQVQAFPGVAGAYIKDLTTGATLGVNQDEVFPTASTIKIHILTRLMQRVEQGELDLQQVIHITPQMKTPGSGVVFYMEGDVHLSLYNLAVLMIIVSDNTATNLCIDLAGMEETNALIGELGLTQTKLRRKMQDNDAIRNSEENVATPAECVAMLEALHQGRPSPKAAELALSILRKPKNAPFSRALPPGVPLANKPGGMERVRCDAGIVYLQRRPYAMSVMTKWAMTDPLDHERSIIQVARSIHETMSLLDGANKYGLGIPRHTS